MKQSNHRRAAALLLGLLLLAGLTLPAYAAGNEQSTTVYLQRAAAITQVSEDVSVPVGGGTTLRVVAEGAGLTYLWQVSTDGGETWTDAPGANTGDAYTLTDARQNSRSAEPFLYRVTVTDSLGQTDSEVVRVTVSGGGTGTGAAGSVLLFHIKATAGDGGSISPAGSVTVQRNADKTFTFTPDAGYAVDTVTVNGQAVTAQDGSYTFRRVQDNGTIHVTFRKTAAQPADETYRITVTAGSGGQASPGLVTTVRRGGELYVYFFPDAGYVVDRVLVDGVAVDAASCWRFTDVTADHTVAVSFKAAGTASGGITADGGTTGGETSGGGASGEGTSGGTAGGGTSGSADVPAITVNGGEAASGGAADTAAPDTSGNAAASGGTAGTAVPSGTSGGATSVEGTTGSTAGPVTMAASTPASDQGGSDSASAGDSSVTVSASAGAHGSVSPSGDQQVPQGGSQTFYFYPDEGYEVDQVEIDGQETQGGDSRTLEDVQGDTELTVSYKPVRDAEAACACRVCAFWRAVFPGLGCICPWCWLSPLLLVLAAAALLVLRRTRRKKNGAPGPAAKQ